MYYLLLFLWFIIIYIFLFVIFFFQNKIHTDFCWPRPTCIIMTTPLWARTILVLSIRLGFIIRIIIIKKKNLTLHCSGWRWQWYCHRQVYIFTAPFVSVSHRVTSFFNAFLPSPVHSPWQPKFSLEVCVCVNNRLLCVHLYFIRLNLPI